MKIAYSFFCAALLALGTSQGAAADGLPKLDLDTSSVTLSGLSSGGYMAAQFHLAHADWVEGVGIIAAGPYFCARNSIMTALSQCVSKTDAAIPLAQIQQQVDEWRAQKLIAPQSAMAGDKVYLLHGTQDSKIARPVADTLYQQYLSWLGPDHVRYIDDQPFAHHFPTMSSGTPCEVSASPYLGRCDYDAASEMLDYIAGYPTVEGRAGQLLTFDQQALGGKSATTLAEQGYVYVPGNCLEGQRCKVHISFHGCNQNAEAVGDAFATLTGINEWADHHNTVVLYPQTKNTSLMPMNPQGCWDWWGYTDSYYATKQGQQIQAVAQMVEHLKGN